VYAAHSKRSKLNSSPGDPAKLYDDAYSVSNDTASTADSTAASSTSGPVIPQPKDHIPFTIAIINLSHGTSHPLVVLLDSGSDLTWDTLPCYPKDATPRPPISSLEIHLLEPSAVTNK